MDSSRTTISISKEIRDKLKAIFKKSETYDEGLNRIMDELDTK